MICIAGRVPQTFSVPLLKAPSSSVTPTVLLQYEFVKCVNVGNLPTRKITTFSLESSTWDGLVRAKQLTPSGRAGSWVLSRLGSQSRGPVVSPASWPAGTATAHPLAGVGYLTAFLCALAV